MKKTMRALSKWQRGEKVTAKNVRVSEAISHAVWDGGESASPPTRKTFGGHVLA